MKVRVINLKNMKNLNLLFSFFALFITTFSNAQSVKPISKNNLFTKDETPFTNSGVAQSTTQNWTQPKVKRESDFYLIPALSLGYYYQNQSFGEIGGKFILPLPKTDEHLIFRIGASAIIGATNSKFAIMPKISTDLLFNPRKEVYVSHGYYYLVGIESTTKSFSPYIGLSVMSVLDITGGYAFSYPNQNLNGKELKGFRLGITINIPFIY